jgi:hypothetical protein
MACSPCRERSAQACLIPAWSPGLNVYLSVCLSDSSLVPWPQCLSVCLSVCLIPAWSPGLFLQISTPGMEAKLGLDYATVYSEAMLSQ